MGFKKGELTTFIILGIVVLAVVGGVIYSMSRMDSQSINNEQINYEPSILSEFNKTTEVDIIVRTKSGIKKESILNTIPSTEYTLNGDLINGFGIKVTKEGFDFLKQNENIKMIYLNQGFNQAIDEISGKTIDYNSLIVSFNGKKQNRIIAKTYDDGIINKAFQEYVLKDLYEDYGFSDIIINVSFNYWYKISNQAALQLSYKEGLSMQEKTIALVDLKQILQSKWYVKQVNYDVFGKVEEDE